MSNTIKLAGFDEAESVLKTLPIELRQRAILKSMRTAIKLGTDAAARLAPQLGASRGGIEYTPRRGKRASRPMLAASIGNRVKEYDGGLVIVAVGGPVRMKVGRHAHLVEKGFHHTTGGTFAGARTRKASRAERTGRGQRRAFIPPRPFVVHGFERAKPNMMSTIVDALKAFAAKQKP